MPGLIKNGNPQLMTRELGNQRSPRHYLSASGGSQVLLVEYAQERGGVGLHPALFSRESEAGCPTTPAGMGGHPRREGLVIKGMIPDCG